MNVPLGERGLTDQQRDPPQAPQAQSFLLLGKEMVSSKLCESTVVLKGRFAPSRS